jgi:hypothetical protein
MSQSGRLLQRYVEALDVCAVVIVADGEHRQPVKFVTSKTPDPKFAGDVVHHAAWCAREHQAAFLRDAVTGEFGTMGARVVRNWIDVNADIAVSALTGAATKLGIRTVDHDTIKVNAAAAVARIQEAVEAMRVTGGLRQVNAAYKAHRLSCERAGTKAPTYAMYLGRFTEGLVAAAAAAAHLVPGGEFGDISRSKNLVTAMPRSAFEHAAKNESPVECRVTFAECHKMSHGFFDRFDKNYSSHRSTA